MRVGDGLEIVAAAGFTVAAWGHFGWWVGLIVLAVSVFYLAQVYADTATSRSLSLPKTIRAGDTVLVRIPASLEPEEFAAVQPNVQKQLPDNRVVVLPSTAEVAAWHPRGYDEPVTPSRLGRARQRWRAVRERG